MWKPKPHDGRAPAPHAAPGAVTADDAVSGRWAVEGRARPGAQTVSLRQILAELDYDHDCRADCDYHRADKRQLFQQADKDRSDAQSSFHIREAPACHTHRTSPFDPSRSRVMFNAQRAPGYRQGVPWIKVKDRLQVLAEALHRAHLQVITGSALPVGVGG
jgi:hypothetical protein